MKVRITDGIAAAIIASMLAAPAWRDTMPPDIHTDVQIPHQPPELRRPVMTANATAHFVTYSTAGFSDRNDGNVGQLITRVVYSMDAAKNTPFPTGCTFARFEADGGAYVFHSPAFGWEFFES